MLITAPITPCTGSGRPLVASRAITNVVLRAFLAACVAVANLEVSGLEGYSRFTKSSECPYPGSPGNVLSDFEGDLLRWNSARMDGKPMAKSVMRTSHEFPVRDFTDKCCNTFLLRRRYYLMWHGIDYSICIW